MFINLFEIKLHRFLYNGNISISVSLIVGQKDRYSRVYYNKLDEEK